MLPSAFTLSGASLMWAGTVCDSSDYQTSKGAPDLLISPPVTAHWWHLKNSETTFSPRVQNRVCSSWHKPASLLLHLAVFSGCRRQCECYKSSEMNLLILLRADSLVLCLHEDLLIKVSQIWIQVQSFSVMIDLWNLNTITWNRSIQPSIFLVLMWVSVRSGWAEMAKEIPSPLVYIRVSS